MIRRGQRVSLGSAAGYLSKLILAQNRRLVRESTGKDRDRRRKTNASEEERRRALRNDVLTKT